MDGRRLKRRGDDGTQDEIETPHIYYCNLLFTDRNHSSLPARLDLSSENPLEIFGKMKSTKKIYLAINRPDLFLLLYNGSSILARGFPSHFQLQRQKKRNIYRQIGSLSLLSRFSLSLTPVFLLKAFWPFHSLGARSLPCEGARKDGSRTLQFSRHFFVFLRMFSLLLHLSFFLRRFLRLLLRDVLFEPGFLSSTDLSRPFQAEADFRRW